ncbi:hypothetical protein [Ornithinibacter aureus]|uniref:hypothetical protein n=1 Tax=Ornithinibacter aureus TaxID=622664 RepID=UPI00135CBEDD|nr:hypothetical protein [Ornithinibacter aureus]
MVEVDAGGDEVVELGGAADRDLDDGTGFIRRALDGQGVLGDGARRLRTRRGRERQAHHPHDSDSQGTSSSPCGRWDGTWIGHAGACPKPRGRML